MSNTFEEIKRIIEEETKEFTKEDMIELASIMMAKEIALQQSYKAVKATPDKQTFVGAMMYTTKGAKKEPMEVANAIADQSYRTFTENSIRDFAPKGNA